MPSYTKREIFLALQQSVLDNSNVEAIVQDLLNRAFSSLPDAQLDYLFIGAVFLDDKLVPVKSYFAPESLVAFPVNVGELLADGDSVLGELLVNKLVTTEKVNEFLDDSYSDVSKVKSIILSPILKGSSLSGVLVILSGREVGSVDGEEKDLVEIFTNLIAFSYRLQDMQESLSKITQEVYKMNAKLHQLDKLKDDFVSVASHELRTPMTAIKSYLWMAIEKKKQELSPDLKRYLDRAYVSTDRLINLVNDMLNVSRIESGRIALILSSVDLVELAQEVVNELLPKAQEKGVELDIDDSQPPKVLCDRDKIHEVYINLIGNSLKFTPKGGKITLSFEAQDQFVFVTVADTGRGIVKEDVAKLFTKFGRLDNSYVSIAEAGGTGLGLFITKSLVALHKGSTNVESGGLGKGARFIFSLPVAGSDVAKKLDEEAPKETQETKGLEKTSVLVN